MEARDRGHLVAIGLMLLVTVLWATSWILIKIGLDDLQLRPLSFAGLRYALAALVLAPLGWLAMRAARRSGHALSRSLMGRVAALGLILIAIAQGAQFAALATLPAAAVGVLLSSIPVWVAVGAWLRGAEAPTAVQLGGIGLLISGVALYFDPFDPAAAGWLGIAAAVVCIGASAVGSHLGRDLNRDRPAALGGAIGLTSLSMAIGAAVLLAAGLALEGMPRLDADGWLIVAWLAVVNTAFAFTLYNRALATLTAVESSVIINLLPVLVAAMAWAVLGEALSGVQVVGLVLATSGVAIVQLVGRSSRLSLRWRS